MVNSKNKKYDKTKQQKQNVTQKRSLETIYGIRKANARIIKNTNDPIQGVDDI